MYILGGYEILGILGITVLPGSPFPPLLWSTLVYMDFLQFHQVVLTTYLMPSFPKVVPGSIQTQNKLKLLFKVRFFLQTVIIA